MAYLLRHSTLHLLPVQRRVGLHATVRRPISRVHTAVSEMGGGGARVKARSALLRTVTPAVALLMLASSAQAEQAKNTKNVLGGPLQSCCTSPMTGFYRDGFCRVGPGDYGVHAVCAQVTKEFLEFSASRGNDLRSVVQPGERWCLCVARWKEAKDAGFAPPVVLESTSEDALSLVSLEDLQAFAYKSDGQEL